MSTARYSFTRVRLAVATIAVACFAAGQAAAGTVVKRSESQTACW